MNGSGQSLQKVRVEPVKLRCFFINGILVGIAILQANGFSQCIDFSTSEAMIKSLYPLDGLLYLGFEYEPCTNLLEIASNIGANFIDVQASITCSITNTIDCLSVKGAAGRNVIKLS